MLNMHIIIISKEMFLLLLVVLCRVLSNTEVEMIFASYVFCKYFYSFELWRWFYNNLLPSIQIGRSP